MIISPFIGWLADAKLGRYKVIVFASLVSFISSIVYFLGIIFGGDHLSNIMASITYIVNNICYACFSAAMLPFVTDQLIGASSAELSTIVQWFYFFQYIGAFFTGVIFTASEHLWLLRYSGINIVGLFSCAFSLALIIISDCLCQQWLDRTHKVTNPIKLIIQVLNYTRKHKYPERRSAFTYLDEEHPSRMDFGKEKFGGPFTEEEVEDVKTILRLVLIVCCISFIANINWNRISIDLPENNFINVFVKMAIIHNWFLPIFLIPLYQLVIFPFFHNWIPSMLKQIGIALTLKTLGIILLTATEINGLASIPGFLEGYVNCTGNLSNDIIIHIEWYWSIIPVVLYCIGTTMASVLLLEFIIAQAPQKMKGFVISMSLVISGFNGLNYGLATYGGTLCYCLPLVILPVAFYVLFIFLAKRYTLRERNREINIQAIVEEHYERYLDQEEEYERQRHF